MTNPRRYFTKVACPECGKLSAVGPGGIWAHKIYRDGKRISCPRGKSSTPTSAEILARIQLVLMDRLANDTSLIFSVENDVFWVRTVVKTGSHVQGQGKSLIEAFQNFLDSLTDATKDHHQ